MSKHPGIKTKLRSPLAQAQIAIATLTIGSYICLGGAIAQQAPLPAASVRDAWKPVYKQLPYIPLENKYAGRDGKVNPNNTLVSRLIQYHVYVKSRAPNYRLDWKLTLADYLGANEIVQETTYPGANTLRQNPLQGDRDAISRLNRQQRDALVQTLVNIFNPTSNSPNSDTPTPPPTTPTRQQVPTLPQPKPGDADLLKP